MSLQCGLAVLLLSLRYGRALGEDTTITEVATAAQLQNAVAQGAEHIVVREHLDLRDVEPQFVDFPESYADDDTYGNPQAYALDVSKSTRSIMGRCKAAPSSSDLAAEWMEGQCVLVFATSGFLMAFREETWLDHLYLKMFKPYVNTYQSALDVNTAQGFSDSNSSTLYMTQVTIEGMRTAKGLAIVTYSNIAAKGLHVLNFSETVHEPFNIIGGAFAYIVDSRFTDNHVDTDVGAIYHWEYKRPEGLGGAIYNGLSNIKLERVVFRNNSGRGPAADYDVLSYGGNVAQLYSDASSLAFYYDTFAKKGKKPRPLSDAPDDFPAFDDAAYVTLRDQVEAALKRALPSVAPSPVPPAPPAPVPPAPPAPAPSADTPGSADKQAAGPQASKPSPFVRAGLNAGVVVGVLAAVACATIAAFAWRRRRRLRSSGPACTDSPGAVELDAALPGPQPEFVTMTQYTDTSAGFQLVPDPSKKAPTHNGTSAADARGGNNLTRNAAAAAPPAPEFITMEPYNPDDVTYGCSLVAPAHGSSPAFPPQQAVSLPHPARLMIRSGNGDMNAPTDPPTRTNPLASPRCDFPRRATRSLAVEDLAQALDDMLAQRQLLMGIWQVLGASGRRVGGQGCVQFIKDAVSGEELVAKFFLDIPAFRREAELYSMPKVREMMAAVVSVQDNADGALQAPNGLVLPPFIVLERGRSLHEWALIDKPDYVTVLQVLVQIVERLCALHACGLVHRDIKPANILWRRRKGAWTLIDFGCAAPIGEQASLACSAPYAAPEVAQAFKDRRATMEVHAAVDIWALGVAIWELFVDRRAFPGYRADEILDALTGSAPLPWDIESERAQNKRKLGLVNRVVAQCLSRDAGVRPTAEELYLSMDGVFREATTLKQTQKMV